MSTHTAEEIAQEERRYFRVFFLLGVLTMLEVGVIYTPIPHALIVTTLVLLAVVKAVLVAMFYMHLATEKTTLKWIAVTPMILCVFLLFMLTPDLGAVTRMLTHALAGDAPAAEHSEH
jgi:cytochrome c oxidase subunit 4